MFNIDQPPGGDVANEKGTCSPTGRDRLDDLNGVVRPARLELATSWFVG